MTAQDHLEELQALYRPYYYLAAILHDRRDLFRGVVSGKVVQEATADTDVPRHAREVAQVATDRIVQDAPPEVRKRIEKDVADYCAGVKPEMGWGARTHVEFLKNAPNMRVELLSKGLDLAVGDLETASFNSSAIPVPGKPNSWVIALHKGVSLMVYEASRAVAASIKVDVAGTAAPEALSSIEAGKILHERLNYYIHLGLPYGGESEISRHQIILASTVATMAERFVYAHELAHILLGHHNGASLRVLPDDWSGAQEAVHDHEKEHEADALAWELITRVFVRSMADIQMAYAGVAFFLRVADLLESAGNLTAIGTHPPALRRLAYVQVAAQYTAREAGVPFDHVAAIEGALSHGLERAWHEAPLLPGRCPLGELLDRAASSPIPDYTRFQEEVLQMLSHSAPSKLCRALGRALGKAEKELRRLGLTSDAPSRGAPVGPDVLRTARKPLNQFKLVGGLLWLYLTPEIGRFVERHREEYLRESHGPE